MKVIIVSKTWWGSDYIPIPYPVHIVQGVEFSLEWARRHVAEHFPDVKVVQESTMGHLSSEGVEFIIDTGAEGGRRGIDFTIVPLLSL